jgi:hypothetical protein
VTWIQIEKLKSFIQKNPTRCNSVSKFIIAYLYEAQHVSGDTPPIIRSLNLHSSLWFCAGGGLLDVWLLDADSIQQPHVQQLSKYAKPEDASAVLGA